MEERLLWKRLVFLSSLALVKEFGIIHNTLLTPTMRNRRAADGKLLCYEEGGRWSAKVAAPGGNLSGGDAKKKMAGGVKLNYVRDSCWKRAHVL